MIRGIFRLVGKIIRLIVSLLLTLVLIVGCVYVDARYIEPKLLKVEDLQLTTDKLQLDTPLKIVQFSDVHLSQYYTVTDFKKVIAKINELSPDMIIFTGDLIDDNKIFDDEAGAIMLLKELHAKYGKYAVYGNHDHGSNGTKRYARIMESAGFTLLKNSYERVELENGQCIALAGIDDIVLGKPQIDQTFANLRQAMGRNEDYTLFISHAPDVADEAAKYGADLQLSGHTHGGQIRIPLMGTPFTPPYGRKYVKGLYTVGSRDKMQLYVSTGIGTSQLPFRFCNVPNITLISISSNR